MNITNAKTYNFIIFKQGKKLIGTIFHYSKRAARKVLYDHHFVTGQNFTVILSNHKYENAEDRI